ncbi:TonB-dependent hemoglobin/transferrin/lactoferrin family receptor [Salinarimonas ramus]|uniref:TonB-dependent receptor n=1 Tax=Salinarimonas ramus TaxID=690164 RepID=A0A917V469_9HYPH|nr:TonB-dependent hemoglobin/transferrin/lactoferrin family receptor [Salinarimonas ramus]GGK35215.1 TonB-dependent receptor [Salinarimonas ramus]
MRRLFVGAVSLGALALGAGAAGAQDEGVTLDAITVTATKDETRAVDALSATSVVTRDEIRTRSVQRIGTILNTLPNVATQENPDDPATAVNIRGLQDFGRVAVTVDGARQNFQRSGHNADGAFFLDPAFVRVIDITRGPVANVYGSGAIGGVVSFQTVDPDDVLVPGERLALSLDSTFVMGSQTGLMGSGIAAMRPTEAFGALVGLSLRTLDDYDDGDGALVSDSGQELVSGLGKVVFEPAPFHEVELSAQLQRFDFANGLGNAREPRRDNEVVTETYVGRWSFADPGNPWVDATVQAWSTRTRTDQVQTTGTPPSLGAERSFEIVTTGVDAFNTSRFDVGPVAFALTYGVDAFRDEVTVRDPIGSADLYTPSGERTVWGGFVQSQASWGMLDLVGAVRFDAYELSGGGLTSQGDRVSPKLTIGLRPIEGLQIYGTYAEGYRAPSVTETLVAGVHPFPASFSFIPNPNLRPEVGKTLEAGVNLSFDDLFVTGDRLRGKVSVFRNDVDDYIESIYSDPGQPCGNPRFPAACADASFRYDNIARARLTGAEMELAYDARRWFASVSGGITRGDNRVTDEPLTSIYPDQLTLGAGLRFLEEKLTLGGRVTFVGAQDRLPLASASLESDAYTLVDLYGSYDITPDARAYVTLENVGDVQYRRFRDGADSPGFVAKVGFQARLGM